jgi:hypothetical protein
MAGSLVRRLPSRWRKLLLTLHVAGSVALLGADGSVLLLGADAALGAEPRDRYPAAALVGSAILVPLALVALVTGTALALLTPWGLFRHWWVTLKLVLTLAGTVLAFVVLTPTLDALAEAARAGAVIAATDRWVLVRDSGAASVVLLATVVLAVVKPFGRLHGRRRRGAAAASRKDRPPLPVA